MWFSMKSSEKSSSEQKEALSMTVHPYPGKHASFFRTASWICHFIKSQFQTHRTGIYCHHPGSQLVGWEVVFQFPCDKSLAKVSLSKWISWCILDGCVHQWPWPWKIFTYFQCHWSLSWINEFPFQDDNPSSNQDTTEK